MVIVLLGLAGVVCAQEEVRSFEVYSVFDTDPDAALEVVQGAVGANSNVVLDRKNLRLLVMGTEAEHEMIKGMMEKISMPPVNVRIEVRFREQGRQTEEEISAKVKGSIGGGKPATIEIQPRVVNQLSTTSSDTAQILLVASGREGRLQIGESVPYLDWFSNYGRRWGYFDTEIKWRDVGSYLVVRPRVIGDGPRIHVTLTPELSGLVDGNPYRVEFKRAATELTTRSGETVRIGGAGKNEDFYDRFLVGYRKKTGRNKLDIELTPYLQRP